MSCKDLFNPAPKVKRAARLNVLPDNPEATKEDDQKAVGPGRFPSWLHRQLPKGGEIAKTSAVITSQRLKTVCEEARCPNLLECWSKKTATFLTMGKECTRNCGFCSIDFNKTPQPLEADEPERIAESIKVLGLKHAVLTMVARDDLPDGGAKHLAIIISKVRAVAPETTIEVLTSDFQGNQKAWNTILSAHPEIFNYNIETVRRLTPRVRHKATYDRTLELLTYARTKATSDLLVKSGLMVGLGETKEEIFETLRDLKNAGCDIVTIGQYLQSATHKLLVKAFIPPEEFKEYEAYGHSIGIKYVYSGPFVRSSYNAGIVMNNAKQIESL